jgi:hypothetical protein
MTFEDFTESVIAGWVPLYWHSAVHLFAVVARWLAVQAVVVVSCRLRK